MNAESIIGMVGFAISIVGLIVAAVNHTRIRSNCFGRKMEISIDVEKTTPVLSSKSAFELRLPDSPVAVAKTSRVLKEEIKEDKETNA